MYFQETSLLKDENGFPLNKTPRFQLNIKGAALMKQVKTAANKGVQDYQHWLYATFWQDNPVVRGYLI